MPRLSSSGEWAALGYLQLGKEVSVLWPTPLLPLDEPFRGSCNSATEDHWASHLASERDAIHRVCVCSICSKWVWVMGPVASEYPPNVGYYSPYTHSNSLLVLCSLRSFTYMCVATVTRPMISLCLECRKWDEENSLLKDLSILTYVFQWAIPPDSHIRKKG